MIFFKLVITTKNYYLWEKEIKNPEEERLITEVMVKEDSEKLQNLSELQKKNPRSKD